MVTFWFDQSKHAKPITEPLADSAPAHCDAPVCLDHWQLARGFSGLGDLKMAFRNFISHDGVPPLYIVYDG